MPKSLLTFCLLLICGQFSFANKIDQIKTDRDVKKFLESLNKDWRYKRWRDETDSITIIPADSLAKRNMSCDSLSKTWNIKSWAKIDINNDGLTDLFFICDYQSYIAIAKANNSFNIIRIYNSSDCGLAVPVMDKNKTLIVFHSQKPELNPKSTTIDYWKAKRIPFSDTLIYKFGGFIEVNNASIHYNIDSITFSTTMCFGECPVFKIEIDKYGNAKYTAGRYAETEEGVYKSKIGKKELNAIFEVVNYLDVKKLKSYYSVDWTDSPTCSLRIKFSDGSVKEIRDYGELGTFGLRELYAVFFSLKDTQFWDEIN